MNEQTVEITHEIFDENFWWKTNSLALNVTWFSHFWPNKSMIFLPIWPPDNRLLALPLTDYTMRSITYLCYLFVREPLKPSGYDTYRKGPSPSILNRKSKVLNVPKWGDIRKEWIMPIIFNLSYVLTFKFSVIKLP